MSAQQWAAARALVGLMIQIRFVHNYPERAATVPVLDICRIAAGAGSAIIAAGARRGFARRRAFTELSDRWRQVPPGLARAPIPPGPAMLRYARYREAHADYDVAREASAVLVAAVPNADPAGPWTLASEELAAPTRFRITDAAFAGVQLIGRDHGAVTIGDGLTVHLYRR